MLVLGMKLIGWLGGGVKRDDAPSMCVCAPILCVREKPGADPLSCPGDVPCVQNQCGGKEILFHAITLIFLLTLLATWAQKFAM